jgi:GTP:adenosylcobinamide-phosphate guanylyltransferase
MRNLTAIANKVSREELALTAMSYAVHYHNLMFKALEDVLVIVEAVEAYEERRNNYFMVGDQLLNNDSYYAAFVELAADVNTAREIERASRTFRIVETRRAAVMAATL